MLQVGDTVGGVKEQAEGSTVQAERNRVDREIPAAQVLVDGGRRDDRASADLHVALLSGHGDLGGGAAGEKQLDASPVLVDGGFIAT